MTDKRIKGITIEIGGDTTKLGNALKSVEKNSKDIQSELRQVERLLKLDPKNTELLAQRQKLLADAVQSSKEKLDTLKLAQKQAEQAFKEGKIGEDQYRAIQREVIGAEHELKKLEKTLAGANDKWKQTAEEFNKFGQKTEAIGKKMLPVTAVVAGLGVAAAYSAMELEATEAKYNTVFGEFTKTADAFISKFKELTPATTAEARNMAAGIQDLLVPMGFMREEATQMTGELMHVIGALANFNSGTETAESVTTKINAALTGEYSSLKSLGIQLDVNTVKQKAVEMRLARSTNEVTKQMMAQVALSEIYAQSSDALAAYTKENLDAKTKMSLFIKDVQDLAAKFGAILLPAISALLDKVRGFINWLSGMNEGTRKVIVTIGLLVAAIAPLLIIIGKLSTGVGAIIDLYLKLQPLLAASKLEWISNTAAMIVNKAAMLAHAVAQGIMTAATATWSAVCLVATTVTTAFGAAMAFLTSPIGLVILAVTALIAIGILLYKNWDSVVAGLKKLWEDFKNFFVSLWESIKGKVAGVWNSITDGVKKGINTIIDAINFLIRAINKIPGINIGEIGKLQLSTDIPKFHRGGVYRAPKPGGEGLAVLRDGERISPPGESGGETVVQQTIIVKLPDGTEVGRYYSKYAFSDLRQKARAVLGVT